MLKYFKDNDNQTINPKQIAKIEESSLKKENSSTLFQKELG
jgi:hypothetical protein